LCSEQSISTIDSIRARGEAARMCYALQWTHDTKRVASWSRTGNRKGPTAMRRQE